EGESPSLIFAVQSAYIGQVFSDHKGLGKPLRGTLQFIFVQQKFESLNAFARVAQDFIRQRIDRAHRWRKAAGLGEKVLGILSRAQLAVTICEDTAKEPRADQGVLETSLKEMLNDEGLKLDL